MRKLLLSLALSAIASSVIAASVQFVSKTPAGPPGNFNYVYKCTSGPKKGQKVTVTAANDNQARNLARLECDG